MASAAVRAVTLERVDHNPLYRREIDRYPLAVDVQRVGVDARKIVANAEAYLGVEARVGTVGE